MSTGCYWVGKDLFTFPIFAKTFLGWGLGGWKLGFLTGSFPLCFFEEDESDVLSLLCLRFELAEAPSSSENSSIGGGASSVPDGALVGVGGESSVADETSIGVPCLLLVATVGRRLFFQ